MEEVHHGVMLQPAAECWTGVGYGAEVDAVWHPVIKDVMSGGKTPIPAAVLSLQEITCACRCRSVHEVKRYSL